MSSFDLHPVLAQDSIWLADADLCQVRGMADRPWPWLLLVPRRAELSEIDQLDAAEAQQLIHEISHFGRALRVAFAADKLNVGALGNVVPQLHVHLVARFRGDAGWPGPVWGRAESLEREAARERLERLRWCVLQAMAR